jgi:hypothetical protein
MGLIQLLKSIGKALFRKPAKLEEIPNGYEELHVRSLNLIDTDAIFLSGFYRGYPYVAVVTDCLTEEEKMVAWCNQNSQYKWRYDLHSGTPLTDSDDYILISRSCSFHHFTCFAFEEESDYIWFKLTWY